MRRLRDVGAGGGQSGRLAAAVEQDDPGGQHSL